MINKGSSAEGEQIKPDDQVLDYCRYLDEKKVKEMHPGSQPALSA